MSLRKGAKPELQSVACDLPFLLAAHSRISELNLPWPKRSNQADLRADMDPGGAASHLCLTGTTRDQTRVGVVKSRSGRLVRVARLPDKLAPGVWRPGLVDAADNLLSQPYHRRDYCALSGGRRLSPASFPSALVNARTISQTMTSIGPRWKVQGHRKSDSFPSAAQSGSGSRV
jgi:hypothetical protein